MMKLRKEFQLYKKIQKTSIKRMRIKNKKQNKFYFWLKGEIEKKNQFIKKTKRNQKNEDQNWHKK